MDAEGNSIFLSYSCNSACPAYLTVYTTSFSIAPAGTETTLGFSITIYLSDGNMSTDYFITINVAANQPPVLYSNLSPATVAAGSSIDYWMPASSDPDGDSF